MNTAAPWLSLFQNGPMALHSVLPLKVSMATSQHAPPTYPRMHCTFPSQHASHLPSIPIFPACPAAKGSSRALRASLQVFIFLRQTSQALTGVVLLLLQAKGLCVVTRVLQGKISTQALNTLKISPTTSHGAFLRPSQSRKAKTPRFTHLGTSCIFQI